MRRSAEKRSGHPLSDGLCSGDDRCEDDDRARDRPRPEDDIVHRHGNGSHRRQRALARLVLRRPAGLSTFEIAVDRPGSGRSRLFADAVDEELHATALGADVHVEVLALHEELAELPQDTPVRALVKTLAADVIQRLVAPRAHDRNAPLRRHIWRDRVGDGRTSELSVLDAVPGGAALPTGVEIVLDGLTTLAALPHAVQSLTAIK